MNRRNAGTTALMLALFLAGCQASAPPAPPPAPPQAATPGEVGLASWYKPDNGKYRTASGEAFDGNALTAARRTLPLNSKVRFTNLSNGRSVVVRINDRGPYAKERIIDVSEHAA